jgi:signal transduction histidine kinase
MRTGGDGSTPARWLVIASGAVVTGLAIGWPGGPDRWPSTSAPAVLCGVALVLIGFGRIAIPTALGFFAGMASLAILGQLVFSLDASADPGSGLTAPVRASAMMPAALALAGLGVLHFPLLPVGTALCGICVIAIATLQLLLLHDVANLVQSVGIRPEHVTPLPAALMLLSLGLGVTATARLRPAGPRSLGYTWAPHGATVLLVTSSIVLWQALIHLQMRDLTRLTRAAATVMNANLLREIHALGSVLDLLVAQPLPEPDHAWGQEADILQRTSAGVISIAFRDVQLNVVRRIWMSPERSEPPQLLPDDHLLMDRTARQHVPIVTHVQRGADGRPIVRIALARVRGDEVTGFLSAMVDVGTLAEERVATALQDYAMRIEVDGASFFEHGDPGIPWDDPAVQRRAMPLPGGTQWTLLVSPSRALQRSTRTVLPELVFGASLLLALLLGSTLQLARGAAVQAVRLVQEAEQRQQAEAELRVMTRDLERRVHERTEELQWANRTLASENAMRRRADTNLRRSNEDLRQFAAFVSHELRQPLSTIGIWAELLDTSEPPLTDKQRRHLAKIGSAVTRMARLIESELALAQLSHGELPKERVDLAQLLVEIRSDMAPMLELTAARIEIGRLTTVKADPQQLRLLFRNLIENTLKYRGDRPPVIRIEERDPDDVAVCTILVSDNGQGFTPETAERIFTIFDRGADRSIPGAGIGLAICRRIVERHGGRITAQGEAAVGATFVIELPREGGDLEAVADSPDESRVDPAQT